MLKDPFDVTEIFINRCSRCSSAYHLQVAGLKSITRRKLLQIKIKGASDCSETPVIYVMKLSRLKVSA